MSAQATSIDIRVRSSNIERRARVESTKVALKIPKFFKALREGAEHAGDVSFPSTEMTTMHV